MKSLLSKIVKRIKTTFSPTHEIKASHAKLDRLLQVNMEMQCMNMYMSFKYLPSFDKVEFSSYSQNGEDGILLFIFLIIGTKNKKVVEIGAGNGIECNAANLIINHGWAGLLIDGREKNTERGKAFYKQRTNAWKFSRLAPKIVHSWITTENVNSLVESNGFSGEIDLLSLDIDGIDFWILKAIEVISPRVIILEYNNRWAADQSVSVPYASSFVGVDTSPEGKGYFGASLMAYTKLAKEKGYRLIGANSPNTNAFFMRNDTGLDTFPEVSVSSCLSSNYAVFQHKVKYPLIKELPTVEV
ncbi:hypothetical protein [Foetidibacter luteolus]|uniref:hypothetical protein n=1 Tax=Foetidibacter luteolus TaxID=2608880 RepID=UPI00129BDF55|nr:hypothetical protein [Foetidibacter luteolus]